jgi:HAD superfamily hydrolase (TIGR01549 family)
MKRTALVDIDGTLVDTNYHHALAWFRAFREHDLTFPLWELHRHIGMGGDQYVAALAGEEVEERSGEELRDGWKRIYGEMIDEVQPLAGARQLLVDLKEAGWSVVLASSAAAEQTEHYLDLLDVRDVVDGWTTSADVESTKPEPDLIQAAHEKAGGGQAVLLGDSIWDIEAAKRVDVPTVCVLTGGFSEEELREAGAAAVYKTTEELRGRIGDLPVTAPR